MKKYFALGLLCIGLFPAIVCGQSWTLPPKTSGGGIALGGTIAEESGWIPGIEVAYSYRGVVEGTLYRGWQQEKMSILEPVEAGFVRPDIYGVAAALNLRKSPRSLTGTRMQMQYERLVFPKSRSYISNLHGQAISFSLLYFWQISHGVGSTSTLSLGGTLVTPMELAAEENIDGEWESYSQSGSEAMGVTMLAQTGAEVFAKHYMTGILSASLLYIPQVKEVQSQLSLKIAYIFQWPDN